jgi:ABC-type sugar transport system ATPase subunit
MAEPGSDGFHDIVRLEGVQKFFGPIQALTDINLAIGRNEIVGLMATTAQGNPL